MLGYIKKVLLSLSTLCLFVNVVVLLGGVLSRYIFNSSPIWVDEAARYLLIGSVMLMAGILITTNEHMRLSIVDKLPKGKLSYIVVFYRHLVTTAIASFMTYASYHYAVSIANFTTIGLGISKSIPLYALPIGFFFITFYSAIKTVNVVTNKEGLR
ncbi:TRAP-type C4-dicarboxylate transport system small permease component [Vibrio maritimus]|uniref:TRAP transporter small permease protein n=1 Tax=Vibrio maritimus TaxID=990268 RepID=A0A090S487_9VIBR|nr:TRAP-type C4-dicarboxylate transport system small permease component [Vibrio maritimus]